MTVAEVTAWLIQEHERLGKLIKQLGHQGRRRHLRRAC